MALRRLFGTAVAVGFLALGAPLHAAPRSNPAVTLATAAPESVGFSSARLKTLDAGMQALVDQGHLPGVTTMVVRHGKVVAFEVHGKKGFDGPPMTKDTIFRIYSQTKPVTGVAMMILFEQGKWRLDDPVSKYIPEFAKLRVFKGQNADGTFITEAANRPPTMREIMSHSAGFAYGLVPDNPVDKAYVSTGVLGSKTGQEFIDKVAALPLVGQPGAQWKYSASVDIQGYIIEKLTGQTLGQFMDQRIFKPLKMNDTAFSTGPSKANRLAAVYVFDKEKGKIVVPTELFGGQMPDYTKPPAMESGGGGLVSTTMDYARFSPMILNKGELDGVRLLSPASVELMGTNVIPKNVLLNTNGTSGSRFNEAVGFGLDFMVVKDARAAGTLQGDGTMSWGGAAGTWFWVDPTNDIIFVGMIQRLGGTGGDDLGGQARTLTYQALTHPEK